MRQKKERYFKMGSENKEKKCSVIFFDKYHNFKQFE